MSKTARGTTALDRLRDRLDRDDHVCSSCGYVHPDPSWEAVTSGDRIQYRRRCDSCGALARRTYRL
ncbi:HVO_0649 family zinc finger protein [Halopenitus persicus]|uniref:HVO_0649 family zinc finger protein n=1 Tax=Halopenitus persicus TaxID=1048396 RepID=UPI000BBA4F11|nr:HVO_0649 family zinc finger protein [Halopenitus persicus]